MDFIKLMQYSSGKFLQSHVPAVQNRGGTAINNLNLLRFCKITILW